MNPVRGRRPGSIGGALAGWPPSEAADRRWAVIRGRDSPRGSVDPGLANTRGGCLLDEGGDESAALIGLGMPLDAERETAVGALDGLGQLVERRAAGDDEPLPERVDALVVMRLADMDLLPRRPRGE